MRPGAREVLRPYSLFTRVTFHFPPVTFPPGWEGTVLNVPSIVRGSRKGPWNVVMT